MDYERFERLVLGVGVAAVLALVAASVYQNASASHIVSELMLWPVLALALHFGRRVGFISAVAAAAISVILMIPVMASPEGLSPDALAFLAGCIFGYGVLGILGGELACRLRYVYARLEESDSVDPWSHAYSQRFAATELKRHLTEYARSREEFSVLLVKLAPSVSAEQNPAQQRSTARSMTNHFRGDLRMVDQVAHLDDGRFLLLLSQTSAHGVAAVASRVCRSLLQLLSLEEDALSTQCLSSDVDNSALSSLAKELSAHKDRGAAQDASGVYNSLGASDRKPEELSTSSAPGASTLKMSTAAAPNGSTKQ